MAIGCSAWFGPYTAARLAHREERDGVRLPILTRAAGRGPRPAIGGRAFSVPPLVRKRRGRLATFVWVDRANAHPARTSDRPTPRAPPPASLCSVPCTPIVEAVMSRRKRKNRTATPTVPTALTAPADHAAQPAPLAVYEDSLPIRHRHAGGVDLGLLTHWVAAPPLADGTPQVAEFDTYTDSLEALA